MTRYSQLYLEREKPSQDSTRMRNRLYKLFEDLCPYNDWHTINAIMHRELGHNIQTSGTMDYDYPFDQFFKECELRDLLDIPTIVAEYLSSNSYNFKMTMPKFVSEANRIFREENVFYQIDEKGGVHPSPDEEFERNYQSTLQSLGNKRYESALNHFNAAHKNLLDQKYDYAIREIFLAAESLAKLITESDKLSEALCRKDLKDKASEVFGDNDHAKKITDAIMDGYTRQIKGYHDFRHAQSTDNNASVELAILAVSNFTAFIRFLVDVDQKLLLKQETDKAV